MAEGSGFVDNQGKLGYSLVKWNIEHFCLATCRDDYVIHSPDFYVIGAEVTKWRLNLMPKMVLPGPSLVGVNLERLESNPGPDRVHANWKFSLHNKNGEEIGSFRDDYARPFGLDFGNEFSNLLDMGLTDIITQKLLPFESDTLIVECRIIVHVKQSRIKTENSALGFGSLSEDLKNLFTRIDDDKVPHSSIKSDIKIEFENEYIKAHSVILHARNTVFRRLLNGERQTSVQIDAVNYKQTKQLVSYLYSGNLDFVLKHPSLRLLEFMKDFEAEYVLNKYQPDLFTLSTAIDAIDERFEWTITNFKSRREYCIQSPVLNNGISGTSWQINVYPEGRDRDGFYVSIAAQCVELRQPQDICIEFMVLGGNRQIGFKSRLQKSVQKCEVLCVEKFADTRSLTLFTSSMARDRMNIIFRVRIASGKVCNSSLVRTAPVISTLTDKRYEDLSKDIERMLRDHYFKDINLIVEGNHQSYHKCILAARSKYFLKMFEREVDIVSAPIPNIDLRSFNILMYYIYSGSVKCYSILHDSISLCQVYDAAQVFDISRFNDDFIKLCQTNLQVNNACGILLFADEKKKIELKNSALKLISLNFHEVQTQCGWPFLCESRPSLLAEISRLIPRP